MSINSVAISGNLTKDSELKTISTGTSVLEFRVAVNDRKFNSTSNEWEDSAGYFNCVMFGKRASSIQEYLEKGTKVVVSGSLRYSSWETPDGDPRSTIEIVVDEIDFSSKKQ